MESIVEPHKPTAEQKRRALVTGAVLAAMAIGVYLVVILKYVTNA